MARRGRIIRTTAITIVIVLGTVILFLAGSIVFFKVGRGADFKSQRGRITALERSAPGSPSESLAADLSVPDDIPLNRLRMIATHNSYRRQADALRMFLMGLVQPSVASQLDYSHPALTVQLNAGLRSFELDVRLRKDRFEIAHVPLVDDRTSSPDLALAMREIRLWSDRNPGHVPLILLLELKNDYGFLDPALRAIDGPALDALDALLRSELGGRLLAPDDVRAGAQTLEAAVSGKEWPRLGAVRGRVIVILHQNEVYRAEYVKGHPGLEGRTMFTCAQPGSADAAIAILNDPAADATMIRDRLGRGFIVRTRADGDGVHGAEGLDAAVASGVQIVSTDFPPAYPAPDGYAASFAQGRLLEIRRP